MSVSIIDERLKNYTKQTIEDEEHALKEILQEIAIYGLSNAKFFDKAVFQGGSALRILYGLPRFSEDLDFLLKKPDSKFNWEIYMDAIIVTCKQYGVHPEVIDKSRVSNSVKKMFLKDDSIGKIIDLSFVHHPGRKLAIKFEIDTNPPEGSKDEVKFLEFPLDFSIMAQDLSSSFAGKCHALLCREYIKGRDWYDYAWYVARKVPPNFAFLQSALYQQGPWVNMKQTVTADWLIGALKKKIKEIDWEMATKDVAPFLNIDDRKSLNLWGIDFFMDKTEKLSKIINA